MKFVCDAMLGKLAGYLRILGLDAEYTGTARLPEGSKGDPEPPCYLTRRTKGVRYERAVIIKSDKAPDQIKEIKDIIRPYIDPREIMNRCIECNVRLVDVTRIDIEQLVPEFIFHQYAVFKMCPRCRKIYWEGSHTEGMGELVHEIMER